MSTNHDWLNLATLIQVSLLAVAMGIVGMAFCVGAQSEAMRIAKARMKGADRLVEQLEALVSAPEA